MFNLCCILIKPNPTSFEVYFLPINYVIHPTGFLHIWSKHFGSISYEYQVSHGRLCETKWKNQFLLVCCWHGLNPFLPLVSPIIALLRPLLTLVSSVSPNLLLYLPSMLSLTPRFFLRHLALKCYLFPIVLLTLLAITSWSISLL